MREELKFLLEEGVKQIDCSLLSITDKLEIFFDEIVLFNPSLKLVGCGEEELVRRHILDCLAPVNIIKQQINNLECNIADLGSGAGLPGIVLALALENCSFTLVERMERRVGFLRNSVAKLGLNNRVEICQKDLNQVGEKFDAVTFRAFRQMPDIVRDLERITKPGGFVFSYKSSEENIAEEVDAVKSRKPQLFECSAVEYKVPMLDAKRSLLILKHS